MPSVSGDAAFVQVNLLLQEVQEARAAVGRARLRTRQVLPQLGRLLWYIRRLPVLHVEIGDSHAGRVIASALSQRRGLVRATTAAAVLALPEQPEAYLVGRSKQAVRTGINHARRSGLSVVHVIDDAERRARALELADGKVRADHAVPLRAWAQGPLDESWFVVDASGDTCAIAIISVDRSVARLDTMISAQGYEQSPARYLLSAHIFMDLIARGVSHVIAENALFLPPGLLYFQKLLGFQQMNIKLSRTKSRTDTDGRTTNSSTAAFRMLLRTGGGARRWGIDPGRWSTYWRTGRPPVSATLPGTVARHGRIPGEAAHHLGQPVRGGPDRQSAHVSPTARP